MDYKEIIKIVEDKRNSIYISYKKTLFFKKLYLKYLNKYDELLFDLYRKFDEYLNK